MDKVISGGSVKQNKDLSTIDLESVRHLVDNPKKVGKVDSGWMMASSYPSRKNQEENGVFWYLWADLDKDPKPLLEVAKLMDTFNADYEIYATHSATLDNQRGRILIPLDQPLTHKQWHSCQAVLEKVLNENGIKTDKCAEKASQVFFLPNQGAFYASYSQRGKGFFQPLYYWAEEIKALDEQSAPIVANLSLEKAKQSTRDALLTSDLPNTITAFNNAYTLQEILLKAGYDQRGDTFRHPKTESGSYSASVKDGRVHSLSTNDPLYSTGGAHDAFSAFTVLFAQGDNINALKLAGDEWLTINGESYNKVKQREHMERVTFDVEEDVFFLDRFALNGSKRAMEKQMLEDKFILNGIAILGQATVIYAQPNAGKTLLTIWMLIESIKNGNVKAEDIYYINADDNFKGLVDKLEFAEDHGFKMLAPGHNGFKQSELIDCLKIMIKNQQSKGKVIILDTVKKFVDTMDKTKQREFMGIVREFVSNGGSVIMLAHVNKNRNDSGKVVAAGTSDLTDDADCAYILDKITDFNNQHTATFENVKSRGNVKEKLTFSYKRVDGQSYKDILATVKVVSEADAKDAQEKISIQAKLENNQDIIKATKQAIELGIVTKTELVKEVKKQTGVTTKQVNDAISFHTGDDFTRGHRFRLNVIANEGNKHVYSVLKVAGLY